MDKGHFYYINNQYFLDFPDLMLMQNKETIDGQPSDRPCFYAFQDNSTGLYWMIPLSSQVSKYQRYYDLKMKKYKHCDTIVFGEVLGRKKAFLIQNICPITANYIKNEYIDSTANIPVRVNGTFERELLGKAKRVIALQRKGINLIFPNILDIEAKLISLQKDKR